MRVSLDDALKKAGILILDGSMSSALEALGCDLRDSLWTARALVECPGLVEQVHRDYFRAGADCGITCSYQATIPGLMAKGLSQMEAEEAIRQSVHIFRRAREAWWAAEGASAGRTYPLCLGSVGPYGAYLADGSEYRGNYGVSASFLRSFHRRRMELLWEAGSDLLLMETQPSLLEAQIQAEIAEEMGADYWISFSCRDGGHIHEGDSIQACARAFSRGYPHLKMLGVNCTPPEYILPLLEKLREATDLPLAVYPNSDEIYDPETKTWHSGGQGPSFREYAFGWMQAGARAVGGCCRTVASHIRQIVAAREAFLQAGPPSHPCG